MFNELTMVQLTVLQRALLEAKFSPHPRDKVLPGSTILAELSVAVLAEIRDRYAREGKPGYVRQWSDWARWSGRGREQAMVYELLRKSQAWSDMSSSRRREAVLALIAPFEATEDEIANIIENVQTD